MASFSVYGCQVVDSVEVAELLACRRVIEFAIEVGFKNIVIEGDNANVTKSLKASVIGVVKLWNAKF